MHSCVKEGLTPVQLMPHSFLRGQGRPPPLTLCPCLALSLAPPASLLLLLRASVGKSLPQIPLQSSALRHLLGFSWPHLALGPPAWSTPAVTPHHLRVSPPWGLITACGAPVSLRAGTAALLGGPAQAWDLAVLDSEQG